MIEKIAAALAMEELLAIRPPIVFAHRAGLPGEGPPMTSNETRRRPMKSTPRCDICNGKFGLTVCAEAVLLQALPGPVSRKEEPAAIQRDAVDRFFPKLKLAFGLFAWPELDHFRR